MNALERGVAAHIGPDRLAWLQSRRVGLAGAGGLGSNCAMHLVRCGFRRLVIADFDRVEPSNLNRQAYAAAQVGRLKVEALAENLLAVNPDLELELLSTRLAGPDMARTFTGCEAVAECFDDPAAKAALVSALVPSGVFVVAASGIGGYGDTGSVATRRVRENLVLVGDMRTPCGGDTPPFSPRVGLAAALQADAILEYFLQRYEARRATEEGEHSSRPGAGEDGI